MKLDKRALALGLVAAIVIGGGLWMSGMLDIRRYFAKPDPIVPPPSQVAPPAIVGPPNQARPAPTR